MKAQPRERSCAARRNIAMKRIERGCIYRIVARLRRRYQIAGVFFEEPPALLERKIEYPQFRLRANPVLVRSVLDRGDDRKLIARVIICDDRRAAIAVERVAEVDSELFVLRQQRQIEIA